MGFPCLLLVCGVVNSVVSCICIGFCISFVGYLLFGGCFYDCCLRTLGFWCLFVVSCLLLVCCLLFEFCFVGLLVWFYYGCLLIAVGNVGYLGYELFCLGDLVVVCLVCK